MNLYDMNPKTKEEARSLAIDYQNWASKRDLSYMELSRWQNDFLKIGKRWGLLKEFKENGII